MTRRLDRPTTGSTVAFGLEAWLIGTPAELDAALAALASVGRVVHVADRMPLAGADHGRWRTYTLTQFTTAPRPDPAADRRTR